MDGTRRTIPCPTCGRPVEWSDRSPYRPFCSKRCRLIDLGEWLDEDRRIPGAALEDEGDAWESGPPH